MSQAARFLFRYALIGLLAAAAVMWFAPELLEPARPVVNVVQAPALPPDTAMTGPASYADAVANAQPAVVNIHTAKVIERERHPLLDDPFFRQFLGHQYQSVPLRRLETSLGSGVIISAQGYVITNHHVIKGADAIRVGLPDGRIIATQVIGSDPDTDIAVLKIDEPELPAAVLGDSDTLRVGDVALAIGNPFGVGQTVTMGIISAKGRSELGINNFEDFIQTDAAINPGNSGGALINARGELIGINTAIFSKSGGYQGIGFAIPSRLVRDILDQIITHGRVIRGWLGVETQDMTPELAESVGLSAPEGVLVASIYRNSPAWNAGVRPGDVLTEIDDQALHRSTQALKLIAANAPGKRLTLRGIRNGKPFATEAEVIERPQSAEDSQ
ncbi:MAG: Do family serine endopeptidase [Gammaproteobacteria bacterium]|nr:Do family serine endopeptidase [Gammaproteobacteria bacterium]MCP5136109.1 Do family serine endopeptidase [Gammaproteobacteria bacterium]